MTATEQPTSPPPATSGRSRWWNIFLVGSLALNLLLAGAIAARWFREERMERFSGASYTQLLPRRFMGDLPSARRKELFTIMGSHRKDFRAGRDRLGAAAVGIADALQRDPYDPDATVKAIDAFGGEAADLIGRGSDVAKEIFAKLTPEERKMLAVRIRERASGHRPGHVGPPPD